MIEQRYYSDMLERYFDTKEAALAAEEQRTQQLFRLMDDLRSSYIKLSSSLRKGYARKMSRYRRELMKSAVIKEIQKVMQTAKQ